MTDAELLQKVKVSLGITGAYQDETLQLYIDEVKNYLIDAGIHEAIIASSASVGVITRGVSDLWNYGMGNATLSEYFYQRALQLKYAELPEPPKVLGTLEVESFPGIDIGMTQLYVSGASADAIYKYEFNVDLPIYDADLSSWNDWDGYSEIMAEDGHEICVAEVTSESLARSAGSTIVVSNLG